MTGAPQVTPAPPVIVDVNGLPRLAVSLAEAATIAGVGTTTLREEIATGRLEARKAGKRLVVPTSALAAWVQSLPPARMRPQMRRRLR
jgi:hypothetical protein